MSLEIALVALGGGIGALVRYLTALITARLWGETFPWGTLAVNLAGCFLIGVIYAFGVEAGAVGPRARLFVMTGLLGGFTTFSTFSLETSTLLMQGAGWEASLNLVGNVVGGLMLFMAGLIIGRILT
ncbi:MAG TPA: fluoride efflux transporter CrcB [Armatimonadetes bacterium]|nr:fluoride efflux transporter CrcB [Armatimonadota bacterium]